MDPRLGPPGLTILLNGTSSSGKSSIATQLLRILDEPYFHLTVDTVNGLRAKRQTQRLAPGQLDLVLARTRAGFHRALAGLAQAGNNVVADYVLCEPWRLRDLLEVMAGCEVVFVGVHCAAAELARREQARGDRPPGLAATQLGQVHAHGCYDLECDTTTRK